MFVQCLFNACSMVGEWLSLFVVVVGVDGEHECGRRCGFCFVSHEFWQVRWDCSFSDSFEPSDGAFPRFSPKRKKAATEKTVTQPFCMCRGFDVQVFNFEEVSDSETLVAEKVPHDAGIALRVFLIAPSVGGVVHPPSRLGTGVRLKKFLAHGEGNVGVGGAVNEEHRTATLANEFQGRRILKLPAEAQTTKFRGAGKKGEGGQRELLA